MTRLQLVAFIENIPLKLNISMRRAKKYSSPIPRRQVMNNDNDDVYNNYVTLGRC